MMSESQMFVLHHRRRHKCDRMPEDELILYYSWWELDFWALTKLNRFGNEITDTHLEYCIYCWDRLVTP